jgi:hypothetical protein
LTRGPLFAFLLQRVFACMRVGRMTEV